MKFFEASSLIDATPEAIWTILTDAPSLSRWDSGVQRVEGRIAPGETIKVFSKVSPDRAFPVKVTDFTPPRTMHWRSGMPLGLFKGRADVHVDAAEPREHSLYDARGLHRADAAADLGVHPRPGAILRAIRDRSQSEG